MYNRKRTKCWKDEGLLKIQSKLISLFMILLFLILIVVNYALNISGPAIKAETEFNQMILKIQETYPNCDDFYRHSFRYVTYSASDDKNMYLFNHYGELIQTKVLSSSKSDEAIEIAASYGLSDAVMHIGYGYENAVYVFEQNGIYLYLDYDTLEIIYYMKEKLL